MRKYKYNSADMCMFLRILVLIVTLEHGHGELFEESWKDLESKTPLKYIKWFVSLPQSVCYTAIPHLYLHI